jgi:metal-responsive CopG/Arc/MetJ family transcriptional regulator
MKTIAITIDEATLARVDWLAARDNSTNRSRIIREAVQEYVSRAERATEDEREDAIVRRHRGRLARQARALVGEQAKP